MAAIEGALLAYIAVREAGPMPPLRVNERHQQALAGLRHAMALDPDHAPIISIHHRVWSELKKKFIYPGNAHTGFDEALKDAFYWANRGFDAYWSMAAQAKPGEHYPGLPYPRANRRKLNAVAVHCLYMDVDVKPDNPNKGHASTREAAETLLGFIQTTGLTPSMVVGSGTGGLHVYWRLKHAISVKEFTLAATKLTAAAQVYGLKFDAQCTMDFVRVLRVPGTWNFKAKDEQGNPLLDTDGGPVAEGQMVTGKPVTLVYLNEDAS